MSKVQRIVKHEWGWDGDAYEVSCAVAADGTSAPAADFIDALGQGMWPDPTVELPDHAQVRDVHTVKVLTKMLANEGRLPKYKFNKLEDGVWEIKVGIFRLTFFDTDGDGGFTPKEGEYIINWRQRREYPSLPDFDEFIRLGYAFTKITEKTDPKDIAESIKIRTEDLQHDEPE